MMERLTSKRLGRRAYFRSLLMLGLFAGGTCAPLTSLDAQLPGNLSQAIGTLPAAPDMLPTGLPLARSRQSAVDSPERVVKLLGLQARKTAATSRFSPLAMPSPSYRPQVQQVQFESSPQTSDAAAALATGTPANGAHTEENAGVVTHAYLVEPGASTLQRPGQSRVRPLSSARTDEKRSTEKSSSSASNLQQTSSHTGVTSDDSAEGDAPILGGPVKYDPAAAGPAPSVATEPPQQESESLLDVDLSALAAQGPLGLQPGQRAPAPSVLVKEETTPKIIGTEQGSLGASKPVTLAPKLTLSDASAVEEVESTPRPVKAQLASSTANLTRVKIHETFAPRPSGSAASFRLSDQEAIPAKPVSAQLPVAQKAVQATKPTQERPFAEAAAPAQHRPLAQVAKLAEAPKPVHAAKLPDPMKSSVIQRLPVDPALSAELTLENESSAEPLPVDVPQGADAQASTALPTVPARLPSAPALPGMPLPAATAAKETAGPALVAPFIPGTEGLVVKASRPGLELAGASPSDTSLPAAGEPAVMSQTAAMVPESPAPAIASSSAQRSISLRIGEAAPASKSVPVSATEQRKVSDHNPIALSAPVVRPVKQVTPEPVTRPAAAMMPVPQPNGLPKGSKQHQLVQDLTAEIKKTFPSSRVDLKADEEEEGLVAEGVAASESEAKKILALVRRTALCPVADRIITHR